MYFANMYCYGRDNTMVGITGIVGCMGVIYVGAASMYAIHIPDHGAAENKDAGQAFVTWVKNQEQNVGKGYLFAFANGTNRSNSGNGFSKAEDETRDIRKGLGNPTATLYRIMQHLGPNSGGQSAPAVAIMLERVHASGENPSGCAIWYKQDDKITWTDTGVKEDGQYKVKTAFQGTKAPSELNAHWWRAGSENCTLISI